MAEMNEETYRIIQPELTSGESILWMGQPNRRVIFHKLDILLIPFSLLWAGFSIFWENAVLSSHVIFPVIWGIPFVLVGQYMVWGRFLFTDWLKKGTHYAVTSRRVIVVQNGITRRTASAFVDTLPTLIKEAGASGTGTLRFAVPLPRNTVSIGGWDGMIVGGVPTLADIDDVDTVYRLVSDLREKASAAKTAF